MPEIVSRRERKKEETRSRIFRAAIDLFRERGFEQTTVDEITERADVAKGTFFNYFPRKDAVLGYLSETRLLDVEENAGRMFEEARPARQKLFDLYDTAVSAYEEDHSLSRYVVLELMGRAFAPSEDIAMRWHELVVRLVRQGQDGGELRSDVDPVRLEAFLTGIYYATLYTWVCCPVESTFPLREELHARLTLAMEGVAT
jgi:AcrR family transcriptional regulator